MYERLNQVLKIYVSRLTLAGDTWPVVSGMATSSWLAKWRSYFGRRKKRWLFYLWTPNNLTVNH